MNPVSASPDKGKEEKRMFDITALFKLSYGVYLLGARDPERPGKLGGCLVNTVFQLTAEPIRVGVSVAKANQTHDFVLKSGTVAVTAVGEEAESSLLGVFGYRTGFEVDKFAQIPYDLDQNGDPWVKDGAVGHYACRVEQTVDLETHTLFVCAVEDARANGGSPMTYNYFRQVKRLKSSKYAPTYAGPSKG